MGALSPPGGAGRDGAGRRCCQPALRAVSAHEPRYVLASSQQAPTLPRCAEITFGAGAPGRTHLQTLLHSRLQLFNTVLSTAQGSGQGDM